MRTENDHGGPCTVALRLSDSRKLLWAHMCEVNPLFLFAIILIGFFQVYQTLSKISLGPSLSYAPKHSLEKCVSIMVISTIFNFYNVVLYNYNLNSD
jgi:hypothetical protein